MPWTLRAPLWTGAHLGLLQTLAYPEMPRGGGTEIQSSVVDFLESWGGGQPQDPPTQAPSQQALLPGPQTSAEKRGGCEHFPLPYGCPGVTLVSGADRSLRAHMH